MKKLLAILLACMMIIAASAMAEGVTLTIMGNANDLAKPYMTKVFELYENATGNKLDIIGLENDSFNTVATGKFATGDIPDILQNFNNSNLSNYAPEKNF